MSSHFPYPGFRPFRHDESDRFFGRDVLINELASKLSANHFISVLGDSGCGKSSLVGAGLIPRLLSGAIHGKHWKIATMRPQRAPFTNLAEALLKKNADEFKPSALRNEYVRNINADISQNQTIEEYLSNELREKPNSYMTLEKILPRNHCLLIVVDQFEELFRYRQDSKEAKQEVKDFIDWLLCSCYKDGHSQKIYVVTTMRTEFLDKCGEYEKLADAINSGFYLVSHLTDRQQVRQVIENPIVIFNGSIQSELVEQLLDDVLSDDSIADRLSLLQYTLLRMWILHGSKMLTLQQYQENKKNVTRRLAVALNEGADEIYCELTAEEKRIAEILFRRISYKNKRNYYVRCPVGLDIIERLTGANRDYISKVVEKYSTHECRILFYLDETIDISHEGLIRQWNKLKEWADEETELTAFYIRWEQATTRYNKTPREGELWKDLNLASAEKNLKKIKDLYLFEEKNKLEIWAERHKMEQSPNFDQLWQFLEDSRAAEKKFAETERERWKLNKKRKYITYFAVFGLVVMYFAFGFAVVGWREAIDSDQEKTETLFESTKNHAALIAKREDYAQAHSILGKTRVLDEKITLPSRHARDLLSNFIELKNSAQTKELRGAKDVLFSVALNPVNKNLIAVGENGVITLFDTQTNILKRIKNEDKAFIRAIVVDPNGQWFITGDDERKIVLWSSTGELLNIITTSNKVKSLATNKEGSIIASGSDAGVVSLWSISPEKKLVERLNLIDEDNQEFTISSLAFSPNGQWLASGSYDNTIKMWQVSDRKHLQTEEKHTDKVKKIAFSPDGNWLASASDDATVMLWSVSEKGILEFDASLRGHQDKVFALSFIDNKYLASGGVDNTVRLWDIESGETVRVLQGHSSSITGMVSDGKNLFTSSTDMTVKQWDTNLPNQYLIDLKDKEPRTVVIDSKGERLAIGTEDGLLQIYSVLDQKLLATQQAHQLAIKGLAFSSNGQWLASASSDSSAKIWTFTNDELVEDKDKLISHKAPVSAVTFSPDNKTLFTSSYDGTMGVLSLINAQQKFYPLYSDEKQQEINSVVATNEYVLTTTDNVARLWKNGEFETPLYKYPFIQHQTMWAAISPDGKQIATVGRDFQILLYYSDTQKHKCEILSGHKDSVIKTIFSPDNQQLLSVGDNTVRAWDLLQCKELFTLQLPSKDKNTIKDFDFRCSPEKCWLATPLSKTHKLALYNFGKIY